MATIATGSVDGNDWRSHEASEGDIEVTMVSQNNLDTGYGVLDDVVLDGSTITGSYYSDTRTSGKLKYMNDGWIRGSFIRVKYSIPAFNYTKVFGTYLATDDPATRKNGAWTTSLTLQNAGLYSISTEIAKDPWTVAKNGKVRTAIQQILSKVNRPYIDSASNDYSMTSPIVLESGKSILEWIYALTAIANLRIDTDGNGRITIQNYIEPSNKSPIFRIDLEDARGVSLDNLQRSTDYLSVPGRAVVSYKYTETKQVNGKSTSIEHEITGSADATGYASPASRGYVITDYHSVTELTPATTAKATSLAQEYIKENSKEQVEWQLSTLYLPIWEGDVVELYIHDGPDRYQGVRKCLVKSVEFYLDTKQMDLTLKEV